MNVPSKYGWELTHGTAIALVIITLTITVHLTGTPRSENHPPAKITGNAPKPSSRASRTPTRAAPPAPTPSQPIKDPSDPHEVMVGSPGIGNRYKLLSIDRKPRSPTMDNITIKLRVERLAAENWAGPFESDRFELVYPGLAPTYPHTSFRLATLSDKAWNQAVVFSIPSIQNLDQTTLQIHYHNYQNKILLDLSPTPADTPE